ncbi:MAG: hypothetical protein M1482_12585 [Chloroflexi bacterium]|nr:hypothetical protein [Chloroflexota bacterium]
MADIENERQARLRRAVREHGSELTPGLERLARAVAGDTEDGISHEECVSVLPELVDAEIAGESIARKYGRFKHHLDICPACAEQYVALLDLALAEEAGTLPEPESIPGPNLDFLRAQAPAVPVLQPGPEMTLPEFVKQKALEILNATAPAQVPDLLSVVDAFFRQVSQLSGDLAFQRGAGQALGLGSGELTAPVATLAVTFTAVRRLVATLSPEQVDALAAENTLAGRAEEQALLAARELNVNAATAKTIAAEFGALLAAEPQTFRGLIERVKP